tara:strand:- start:849 stop:1916 length:1068 start_codon:yes stop_codon:yes gene_type:complete
MAPIKSTKFGYMSMFTDKVEEDNFLIGIGANYSTTQVFEPGNGYQYLIYTAPGYLDVTKGGPVDLLLIGGGGAGGMGESSPPGGAFSGGGGGAGGYLEKFNFTFPIGEYRIEIGDGGTPKGYTSTASYRIGGNGSPTDISGPTITTITAYGGGGGGGSYDTPPAQPAEDGQPGGSGGGGGGGPGALAGTGNRDTSGNPIPSYHQNQGTPPNVQGFNGASSPTINYGGGGGGAGEAGTGFSSPYSAGGDGRVAWDGDDGIPSSYGTPGPTPGRWFAGGGGGGFANPGLQPTYGVGGAGGGGRGADRYPGPNSSSHNESTAGTINTGGGGGGGNSNFTTSYGGKPGGSGIVIVRYKI